MSMRVQDFRTLPIGSLVVPFLGFPYRILTIDHKKELLWSLFVSPTPKSGYRLMGLRGVGHHPANRTTTLQTEKPLQGSWDTLAPTWTPKVCRIIAFDGFRAISLPTFGGLGKP